ncbi:beta-defensin 128 isoform X2 [Tupaia chinensis]|uniref:beta-defensin 128 isoform X2 n=1 Tax=Tupaia chinensis TaxID=246437 RepID=UPI0007045856|nr:beta-defensin 128 isoform X2 [Tupaia chinensis]
MQGDGIRPKKCFNNVVGYCRKKCRIGEIHEIGCLSGKLCCVNEDENKKHLEGHRIPPPSDKKSEEILDYAILPTVTLATNQP